MSDFGRFWLAYLGTLALIGGVFVVSSELIDLANRDADGGYQAASVR